MTDRPGATVGELIDLGIGTIDAFCPNCGNLWQAPVEFLPRATIIETVAALMICPVCDGRAVEIEPVQRDKLTH
jgi:hypothetical protein